MKRTEEEIMLAIELEKIKKEFKEEYNIIKNLIEILYLKKRA